MARFMIAIIYPVCHCWFDFFFIHWHPHQQVHFFV